MSDLDIRGCAGYQGEQFIDEIWLSCVLTGSSPISSVVFKRTIFSGCFKTPFQLVILAEHSGRNRISECNNHVENIHDLFKTTHA